MKILDTERLNLRTISEADAPFYLTLVNDPSWIRNIGDRGIRNLQAARDAINAGPVAAQAKLGFSLYVIERKTDLEPLGLCGLIKRDTLKDVDIGYAFLPAFWGQGYAHEAAQAVVEFARTTVRLPRLAAITSPENGSSNRLLRKLGFEFIEFTHLTPEDDGTNLYQLDF